MPPRTARSSCSHISCFDDGDDSTNTERSSLCTQASSVDSQLNILYIPSNECPAEFSPQAWSHYVCFLKSCKSANPFIYPLLIHPLIHPSIILPLTLRLSVHLFIHPSIHVSLHPTINPKVKSSSRPSIYPPMRPSVHPSIHQLIHPSFIHSSTHPCILYVFSFPSIHAFTVVLLRPKTVAWVRCRSIAGSPRLHGKLKIA